jgi:hypothetical protein
MAAVDFRSSVDLLLSLKLERRCSMPLFFLPALELTSFFAEADVAQHVVHQGLAGAGHRPVISNLVSDASG